MADISITVATPAFGEMFYAPYVQSVLRLQRALHQRNWTMRHMTVSYADVVEARNFLLTHWFDKSTSSHLLFVDADMGFEPRLIFDMLAFDKPVVGAIYTKRHIDLGKIARLSAAGEPAERAIAGAHDFIVRRPGAGRRDGFIPVEACGTGIFLIARGCIEEMLKKLPAVEDRTPNGKLPLGKDLDRLLRVFDPLTVNGGRLSEDFSFCHRWRALCGGEIWANIAHEITHVGLHKFKGKYSDVPSRPRIRVVGGRPARIEGGAGKGGNVRAPAPKVVTGRLAAPAKGRSNRK